MSKDNHKIILRTTFLKGSATLQGEYKDRDGKMYYLTDGGRKVKSAITAADLIYNPRVEAGHDLKINCDESVRKFYMNHPSIMSKGYVNPNAAGAPRFEVVETEEVTRQDYDKILHGIEIANKVIALSPQEKQEAAFALGIDPRGMGDRELLINLVGLNLNGLAILNSGIFNDYYSVSNPKRLALVFAHKAVKYGLVQLESGQYTVGGRVLGASVQDIASLSTADPEFFESYIVANVTSKDGNTTVEDDSDSLSEFMKVQVEQTQRSRKLLKAAK